MKVLKRAITFLVVCTILSSAALTCAADQLSLEKALLDTRDYLLTTVPAAQPGQVGGEWVVFALARLGESVPEGYFEGYYQALEDLVREKKGVLHTRKYSEYARTVLALTSIGRDPTAVGGYDLLAPLGDYEQTVWQGIMGPIMALLALDSGRYEVPQAPAGKTQASRELYLDYLLDRQLSDGGFSLNGETGDADITAMAVQALAKYLDRENVKSAVERAVNCLSRQQEEDGGFCNDQGQPNLESTAQVVIALCELGISPEDGRFMKNGNTVGEAVRSYDCPGAGFAHTPGGETDAMATEQAFYAMVALARQTAGKTSLYTMTDVKAVAGTKPGSGLPGKDSRVRYMPVTEPGKTFPDIPGHLNQTAIESLAARQIITGKNGGLFDPDSSMTRAEFAALVVKALGMEPVTTNYFTDVPFNMWYAGTIGAAHDAGLIDGVGGGNFAPERIINRQQAAVMVARAAALCGINTQVSRSAIIDTLSQFPDHKEADGYAEEALAFCYRSGILNEDDMEIRPLDQARRCEVAEMVWRLLKRAALTEY